MIIDKNTRHIFYLITTHQSEIVRRRVVTFSRDSNVQAALKLCDEGWLRLIGKTPFKTTVSSYMRHTFEITNQTIENIDNLKIMLDL